MKQRNLHVNHLWRVALCGCMAAVAATSCVDDAYDLDKEISTEVNVLSGLTLPIGTISPIFLSDLIDLDSVDMLSLVDGKYAISMSDTLDVSVDLMDAGSEIVITIDKVEESVVETISDNTTFPSFEIGVEDETEVELGLTAINLASGGGAVVEADTELTPNFPDAVKSVAASAAFLDPFDVEPFSLPVELDKIEEELAISPDIECPTIVKEISNIRFGEGGNGVDLSITFDISSFADCFGAFEWVTPSISLEFPEYFVLSNGSNKITFESESVVNSGKKVFTTQIVSYSKSLIPAADGSLPSIEGDITCDIDGEISIVTATTQGLAIDVSSAFSLEVTSDEITIGDFDIAVSGLEFEVASMDLSSETPISGISDNVESVDYIDFEDGTNNLDISISPIVLPTGLSMISNESMTLAFPKSRFEITDYTSVDDDSYNVDIATSTIVADGYEHTIYIEQIKLSDCAIVDGDMSVNPGITMTGAMIQLEGTLSLSDYNNYVSEYSTQSIDVKAMAKTLTVDYAELVISSILIDLPPQNTTVEISEEIPSELVALYTLEFQDGEDVAATFAIDITGLPTGDNAGDIKFVDYTITFPSFLVFADSEYIDENNTMVLNDVIGDKSLETRSFNCELFIESMDFTECDDLISVGDDGNTYLNLDIDMVMSGGLELEGGVVGSDVEEINCNVVFEIGEIKVGKVCGKVAPEMPEISQSVDLSDLTEMIDMGDVSITLSNPSITIVVENPLAIGMQLDVLMLVPYKNGSAMDAIQTTEVIAVAAADADSDEPTTTTIVLEASASSLEGHYQLDGLKTLLQTLPDSLQIEVLASVTGDEHTIDLSKTAYDLNLIYDVNVPLEFDELLIQYADTLSDLSVDLEDIIEMVTSLELQLEITSTFPISIEVADLTAVDAAGVKLELPEMFPEDNKISGSVNGEPVVSQFDICLSDNDAGDLARLDGLIFDVKAGIESSDEAQALKDDQYLQIGIKVCLPEGLTLDIDEL